MRRLLYKIKSFLADSLLLIVRYMPGSTGHAIRKWYWKKRLLLLGKNTRIDSGVVFTNPKYISIDDNCWIDQDVIILAGPDRSNRKRRIVENHKFPYEKGRVHIGKNVHIAPRSLISGIGGVCISDDCSLASGVKVFSFSHHYRSDECPNDRNFIFSPLVDKDRQYMIEGPIYLEENVGVAVNTVILPGVRVGRDSFIAVNSVVFTTFEENSLIAGNPAERIKERFKNE